MTGSPIEDAYTALGDALAAALVIADFLTDADLLRRDPMSIWEPEGDEDEIRTAAALFKMKTAPVRPTFGSGRSRWVVERECRLDLAALGPVPDGDTDHETRLIGVLAAAAGLVSDSPTLGGTCERLELGEALDDDLPPNGLKKSITFTIRVRSGDPLGQTAP